MLVTFIVVGLVALFLVIGRVAAIAVESVQVLSHKIGVPVTFLGVLLGLFTSLPELGVGISAVLVNGTPDLSLGNLMGGGMVILGLVLGLTLVLNRKVKTDGEFKHIILVVVVTLLPFLLFSLDGSIGLAGGIIMIALYIMVLGRLYLLDGPLYKHHKKVEKSIVRPILRLVFSVASILVLTELIMRLTLFLLSFFDLPHFLIGSLLFPLGTNLPELMIAFVAWWRNERSIALANIFGSAMANTPIMGALAIVTPLSLTFTPAIGTLALATVALLLYLVHAYRTDRALSRKEGIVLIFIYALFLVMTWATSS